MSLRQTPVSAAAFEIRFSTTDSELEIFEIQSENNLHERNVPDPFKKRDKIPRSSGSIEQFIINSNDNNNSNNSNSNNGNNGTTAPVRHSSLDSQAPSIVLKSRHHLNGDNLNGPSKKGMSTNSDQISSLKVKSSSNAVGPEADRQRVNNGVERPNSLANVNDINMSDDDSISWNAQYKKQRSSKIDEIASEKEKVNLGKVIPNQQIMDLNGKTEPIVSSNKITMPKITLKNKKINMLTSNYKDDENKSLATPPDTPPRSPHISSITPLSDSDIINQLELEESQLVTPPSSSSARSSGESISRVTHHIPRSSRKRRGSQSSQLSNEYQPSGKLQSPRGRRLSSTERSITTVEEPLTVTTHLSIKSQAPQQSQPIPIRSRIPRLSMSSRERPDIAKKVSQGSLSLSSQESNRFNDSKESLSSSYPVTSKSQSSRGLRSATSRPIINTSSFVTDVEVESESPMSCSPTSYSPTSYSPPSHSPTTMSHSLPKRSQMSHPTPNRSSTSPSVYQKKLTISHDDMIVPTVAKKLKMNGQLHFVNHDALLGYSEEPENISPTTENGYMDITDQVVDLFDGSRGKSHKSHQPVNGSQRRVQQSVRKNSSTGHSRNSSKTHYIAPRKQNYKSSSQQTTEEPSTPTNTQFGNSSNRSTFVDDDFNKQRKSRREEYIMVIHDDDDDMELIEPRSSMPLVPSVPSVPSEPITAPTVQVESHDQIYQEKFEEPVPVEKPIVQETLNPTEVPTTSSGKIKKGKKKQKKGNSEKHKKGNGDSDEEVRRSICRCM